MYGVMETMGRTMLDRRRGFLALALLLVACGGGDSKREPQETDSGTPPSDASTEPCPMGTACGGDDACSVGRCYSEAPIALEVGGLPGGESTVTLVDFPGGACSDDCDPADEDACGACARCTSIGGSRFCAPRCTPRDGDNDICRDGYQCDLEQAACVSGCASNQECQLATGEGGTLVWDPDRTEHYCDPTTFRCRHPGREGAQAGDLCAKDTDCEADGVCFVDVGYEGGYCTKLDCGVEGRSCAGEGVCRDGLCLLGCTVGAESEAERFGPGGRGKGCRVGHACFWNGIGQAFTEGNGSCDVGNYTEAAPTTFGGSCSRHQQCYSPFGYGGCLTALPDGLCTIFDCGAPGLPRDICGANGQCVLFGAQDLSLCLANCASAADCRSGYGCVDWDGRPETPKVCYTCATDDECRAGERCLLAASAPQDAPTGTCVPR